MLDILCIGNANMDAFLSIHEAAMHCRINEKDKEFCLSYGEKIQVDKTQFALGGGACNVAVGLSRLGFTSGVCVEIGDDEFSQKIKNTLTHERVDTSSLIVTPGAQSSFSVGIHFKNERTLFVNHVKREHNFNFDMVNAKWVYLGGLGEEWLGPYTRVIAFVKTKGIKLAFAPGTIQIQSKNLDTVIAGSEILFLNKEEAALLLGNDLSDISSLLRELQKKGARVVVITDGKNGSYVIDQQGNTYQQGIVEAEVVEKTGAGDGYASGFLAAILQGERVETAMLWGAKNAASVIGKIGAQAGLLRKGEIGAVYLP